MIGIYEIRCNVNNKVYVGQSINIERRWRQHRYALSKTKRHPIRKCFWHNQYEAKGVSRDIGGAIIMTTLEELAEHLGVHPSDVEAVFREMDKEKDCSCWPTSSQGEKYKYSVRRCSRTPIITHD